MSIYSEIKKYLLYLVGFFCVTIALHIGFLYMYHDAVTYPLPGGTMNIGVVGKMPTIDILDVDTKIDNSSRDTVIHFLYRGLLRYSTKERKIVGDLANCGIDTFPTIRCTLNPDAQWSDGASVTLADVASTYSLYLEKSKNESLKYELSFVDIQEQDNELIFQFKNPDVSSIDILFAPILKKNTITEVDTNGNLTNTMPYSGPYLFLDQNADKNTILLKKNPSYSYSQIAANFDQIRFLFADSWVELAEMDTDLILSDTPGDIPGYNSQKYIRPVVYSAFINSSRVGELMRKALLNDISKPDFLKEDTTIMPQQNIFLGNIQLPPGEVTESLFDKAALAGGYKKGVIPTPEKIEPVTKKDINIRLKYVTSPGSVGPFFLTDEAIEIAGTPPAGTTKIIINDYTLKNFIPKKSFSYNAKKEFGNLIDGENIYRIQFIGRKGTITEEQVTIYRYTSNEELKKKRDELERIPTPESSTEVTPSQPVTTLDPNKYYSSDGSPLIFKVIVQSNLDFLQTYAENMRTEIRKYGADIDIQTLSLAEIKKNLNSSDVPYDIILAGFNLGMLHYNVAPLFHSGQIKEGYNFSRIRNPSLDGLLEKLTERLYYTAPDKLRSLELSIQKILQSNSLTRTIGTPYEYIFLRDAVLGEDIVEFIIGRELLSDSISSTYFKVGYKQSDEPKSISGLFEWLYHALFSHT